MILFCVLYAYIESVQMHTHGYSIFIRAAVSKKTDNFHAGLEKGAFIHPGQVHFPARQVTFQSCPTCKGPDKSSAN